MKERAPTMPAAEHGNGADNRRLGFALREGDGPRRLRLIAKPLGGRDMFMERGDGRITAGRWAANVTVPGCHP